MRRSLFALLIAVATVLTFAPQAAQAHVERPSYWPDPKPDCHVRPCAGGKIPAARTLRSALNTSLPGRTRVVCKANSLTLLERSITKARAHGYNIRPTDHRKLYRSTATYLRTVNKKLFKLCRYHQIQAAVNASRNNDRVVVMPGLYTEPTARSKPTYDPACAKYRTQSDGGDPGALSHEYQYYCPNDANLIAVIGRGIGAGVSGDPHPALVDRHGIPNAGACIRCNFQLEGSGVSADDVIVEAGSAKAGNGGPSAIGHKKDVGIFADRADGFVLRNLTVRHAREHDIYILETDGYRFDHFKTFYAGSYGVLTFVEDHGLIANCEAMGNGDSGIYPGAGAPTLTDRDTSFYPTARYSQRLTQCDSHHNTGGFSGTDSHGTLIDHNNFYDNALGYTTDVFTAPGHPGFPQEGNVISGNNFYDNNFNPFRKSSDVQPFIGAPVGTGLWLAGGNKNVVRNNHFWDNWRRGMMLFAVPDATVCGPPPVGSSTPVPGCNPLGISTSYDNRIYGNVMGVDRSGAASPNGVDFWWDAFPTNTGNCWWSNTGPGGRKAKTSPASLPNCSGGTKAGTSIGLGDVANEGELVACLAGYQVSGYPAGNGTICTWSKTPSKPGSRASRESASTRAAISSRQQHVFDEFCAEAGPNSRTCRPYAGELASMSWLSTILRPFQSAPAVTPAVTDKRLSSYTCSWWRQADTAHKVGLVKRISAWVGGPVSGNGAGEEAEGYGTVLPDGAAMQLFDSRCSTGYAGPFALYKIYGAAAAFSATHD